MDNPEFQEIFEMLAEVECALYYRSMKYIEIEGLKEAHKAAKEALLAFAKATGCHN